MKLKYIHHGETQSIPLTDTKPAGKRLAIRHDGQNFYAPLVASDADKLPVSISVSTKNLDYNARIITITGGTNALPYIKSNNTLYYARIIRVTTDNVPDYPKGTLLFIWILQPEFQWTKFGNRNSADINSEKQDGLVNTDLDITIAVPETDTHQAAELSFEVV